MSEISGLVASLSPYDSLDLAAGVGALQLAPEFAQHLLRAERLAALAAALPSKSGPRMSSGRWRGLLNSPPLADPAVVTAEDPFEEPFVQSISFFGGSYLSLPGLATDSSRSVSRLLTGIFHEMPRNASQAGYARDVELLATATLRLQDAVIRRAGLVRNTPPGRGSQQATIPSGPVFTALKQAVRFTWEEIAALVGYQRVGALTPLTLPAGSFRDPFKEVDGPTDDRIVATPLLATEHEVVVLLPSCLMAALRHQILVMALRRHVSSAVIQAHRAAVLREAGRYLHMMGMNTLETTLNESPKGCVEATFSFDVDKLCHVVIITDELHDYDLANPFGSWSLSEGMRDLEGRFAAVRARVRSAGGRDGVLHLIITEGIGRDFFLGFTVDASDERSEVLNLSASDLDVVAHLEHDDPLALWKFAKAADALRDHAPVLAFSTLDEFAIYRGNDYSFYLGDDARPTFVSMTPGSGRDLRLEVAGKFDHHGMLDPEGKQVLLVMRRYQEVTIPIYAVDPLSGAGIRVLPYTRPRLWVVLDATPGLRESGAQLCDAVAYWLWQCIPSMGDALSCLALSQGDIVWTVRLLPGDGWNGARHEAEGEADSAWFDIGQAARGFVIEFGPSTPAALSGPDNTGERQLLHGILGALGSFAERQCGQQTIQPGTVVERHAPLGLKKMILALRGSDNPLIGTTETPRARKIHPSDTDFRLDELANWLATAQGLRPSPIPPEKRSEVLNQVVGFFFRQLVDAVAELAPADLLEFLIGQNEGLIEREARLRLTLPTRVACFGGDSDFLNQLAKDLRDATAAALANRFIIEYVAAAPPGGRTRINLEIYDRLMSTASEIINKGYLSDAIHYDLSDSKLRVLGSGRLGISRDDRYNVAGFVLRP